MLPRPYVSGQFTTDDEVMLSFKTTGIINKIYVKEGDAIQRGQLLATLNLTEIDASLEQARLALEKSTRDHQRIMNCITTVWPHSNRYKMQKPRWTWRPSN
jgi:multidrug efflux pump subunit AcrA (membrane-fusion protein)